MLLPSYMSKRQLYIQFCFDRGHIVDDTQKGFKTRPVDKGAILDTRIIPSWPCFYYYYFWKNEYSYLKIATSHEDVAKVAAKETKVAASAAAKSEKAAVASAAAKATKLEEREAQRKIAKATKSKQQVKLLGKQ